MLLGCLSVSWIFCHVDQFSQRKPKKKYGWREKFNANIEIKMYYSTLKSGFTLFLLVSNIPFFTDI